MAREDTHPPLAGHPLAEEAVEAYLAGLAAVEPAPLVRRAVRQGLLDDWLGSRERPKAIRVLALGKAAPRMLWGLVEASVPFSGLGVAPRGVAAPAVDTFEWLPGDHPVPGPASFAAGRRVLEWVDAIPDGAPLLVLLSGGASACLEAPAPGWDEAGIAAAWSALLRQDLPIEELNVRRSAMSALKGGQLGQRALARTRNVRVWMLQDTTRPEAVGSGPFWLEAVPHQVLARADDLVAAAGLRLAARGWSVFRHGARIAGPVEQEVAGFLAALDGIAGDRVALVGGGEAVLRIPADAPPGGRCQHAALVASRLLAGRSGHLFAALASDGVDGGTDAAGGWCLAGDWDAEAERALAGHAAHAHLDARGRLVRMGPTGTNVNDLWVALRP